MGLGVSEGIYTEEGLDCESMLHVAGQARYVGARGELQGIVMCKSVRQCVCPSGVYKG